MSEKIQQPPELIEQARHVADQPGDHRATVTTEMTAEYSGPIPPPAWIAQYESTCPGFGSRLLAVWEKQCDHRQDLQRMIVRGEIAERKRGQWFAWSIALGILAGVVFSATLGHPVVAGTLGGGGLVYLALNILHVGTKEKVPKPKGQANNIPAGVGAKPAR